MNLAPIALFVYNRPFHTHRTIDALLANELASESDLFIFSDGPRSGAERESVKEVREFIKKITGFRCVNIIERTENIGLADSIIAGVTEIVDRYGQIIVLEDDMVTSPYFLRFMNEGLNFYRDIDKVISIHGYLYPVKKRMPETFFLKGADCWGWATWKRGWEIFEPDGNKLLAEIKTKNLQRKFDVNGAYPYTKMLEDQIHKKINSWAIRWNASAFIKDRLTLYPGESLLNNIGTDSSGIHCAKTNMFNSPICMHPIKINPIPIEQNEVALLALEQYYRKTYSFGQRLVALFTGRFRH